MKRKYLFLIIFLVSGLFSCKKQLEEKPFSTLSPDVVFTDEEGLKKATFGVYQSWTYAGSNASEVLYRFVLSESSTRYVSMGMGGGGGLVAPYYRYGQLPTDPVLAATWSRLYLTIARANSIISNANLAVTDAALADTYISEARFLRAYAYFYLVRNFGGVPLITRQIKSLEDADLIYAPKATIEETYDFIVEDIKFAETHLPDKWTGADAGRISAGIAKAMLGKVYLHMAGEPLSKTEYFQQAATKLLEVVGTANETKYNFGLLDNFRDVFSLATERSKERVLSFGYFVNPVSPKGSVFPFYLFPRGYTTTGAEQTSFGLSYALYNLFEPQDTRRDVTLIERFLYIGTFQNEFAPGDSIIFDPVAKKYRNKRNNITWGSLTAPNGISFGKLAPDPRPVGGANDSYSTDLIELRFSDVLLCLAEALIESGNPGDALQYINRVRDRAGATDYGILDEAASRAAVRKERVLELTGEFTSVFDIRRWGTLQQEVAATDPTNTNEGSIVPYDPKFELYPIPQGQIDANVNLVQNTGWQ